MHQRGYSHTDTLIKKFWERIKRVNGCWEYQGKRVKGYGDVGGRWGLSRVFGEKSAHRLAWVMTYGPIPGGLLVLHSCDNPPCINPFHLHLGTDADNARERSERGRGTKKKPKL